MWSALSKTGVKAVGKPNFSIEMLGALLRPFFLGLAINDLLKGSYLGLIYLSVCHLTWLIVGTIRHMYDTRTYSAIYTSLVTSFLHRKLATTNASKLSAHSTLSREIVDFLETDFPYIIEAIYNILGSLIITISRFGPDSDKLPCAHTCFNHLLLPEFEDAFQLVFDEQGNCYISKQSQWSFVMY